MVVLAVAAPLAVQAKFRDPVRAQHAMVVSTNRYATEVGVWILQEGGNAVDAAVAVGFALAVTHPQAGNLGGGGFMVVRLPDGTVTTFDYREKAPLRASRDMYLDENGNVIPELSRVGYLACGVPGTVAGLFMAHQKYGRLPWSKVIRPAIRLAEKGFPVSGRLHRSIRAAAEIFSRFPASARKFLPGGQPLPEGSIFKQPDLARTLRLIARQGPYAFYHGEIARKIAEDMAQHGGLITLEDLARYRAVERKPVRGTYRGFEIISMGPPSSGGLCLIEALNILEGFDLSQYPPYSAESISLIVETMKRVYADRAEYMGDSDFYPVPVKRLLSKDYAAERRKGIQPGKVTPSNEISHGNIPVEESPQTTHYSVVDEEGMAVSVTTTLNSSFGSKVVIEGAGFLMNNEMDDFSAKPGAPNIYGLVHGEANAIAPEKRMLSSMTPTIIAREGKLWAVIGTPGGSTIISQVLVAIINMIDYGMNIAEAIHAPKFHHQWLPDVLVYEPFGIWKDTLNRLAGMGYELKPRNYGYGDLMGIQIEDETGVRLGCADPRHDGVAKGY